jgi:hypothetical protein
MTEELTQVDREALQDCLNRVLAEEPEFAPSVNEQLKGSGFCRGPVAAALFCSMHLQRKALGVRPWLPVPADWYEGGWHGESLQNRAAREKLTQDLIDHGISIYTGDPIAALAAKAAA